MPSNPFQFLVILFVVFLIGSSVFVFIKGAFEVLLLLFPFLSQSSIESLKIVSPFYNNLHEKDKKIFRNRVSRFITRHRFVPKEQAKIDKQTKIMVASIAVMLTFRLKEHEFEEFENIIIYPKSYYSTLTQNHHKGETNAVLKTIVFSLEDFKEGIKVVDDNINLGIHEFTHALHLIMLRSTTVESDYFIQDFNKIVEFVSIYQKQIEKAGYIREYAFVNEHELLAVITENYFETPQKFKTIHPEIFEQLNKMYKIYS